MAPSWMMSGFVVVAAVIGVLFVVLLVAGIVVLSQSAGRGTAPARRLKVETSLETLERRYASGDITKEQFEDMKMDLGL